MGAVTYMDRHPKSGVYRVRRNVPEELRPLVRSGQKVITQTLGTKDLATAKRRQSLVNEQINDEFDEARRKLAAQSAKSPSTAQVEHTAKDEHVGEAFARFWDPVAKKYRWAAYAPMLARDVAEEGTAPVGPTAAATRPSRSSAVKLGQVLDEWAAEQKPAPRTLQEWTRAKRIFVEINGDLAVPELAKAHVRAFKDALQRLPKHLSGDLRRLSTPEILAKSGITLDQDARSTASIEKAMRAVSVLIEFARRNYDEVTTNPFEGMIPNAGEREEKRLPWSIEQLNSLFASPIYAGCRGNALRFRHLPGDVIPRDEWRWLPLLALFTGARLEELGQLLTGDVKEFGGVHYIDITTLDDEGNQTKRLKNASSKRQVPLHPKIIQAGFLDYVLSMASAKEVRLFPNLKPNKGKVTAKFSKDFGVYKRAIGVTNKQIVFHSLRHNFKDAIRAATESDEIRNRVMGHATGTEGSQYGLGDTLLRFDEVMRRLVYSGLTLDCVLRRG